MRKRSLFVYLQSLTCVRAFVRGKRSIVRARIQGIFWDGLWSRVIHFQEEVQVLIACSDHYNRFYRVSNAVGAVFVEMLRRLVARGCAEGFFSFSLSYRKEKENDGRKNINQIR